MKKNSSGSFEDLGCFDGYTIHLLQSIFCFIRDEKLKKNLMTTCKIILIMP